jgi:hypothetical protein
MRSCSQAPAASAMRCAPAELDLSIGSCLVSVIVFGPRKKKPAWWNTLRYSTTPAYSSTGPPAKPECPLSSRPTKPAHVLLGFARSLTQAIPIEYYCPTWSVNSKGSFSISHMTKSRMIVDYRFGLDRDRTHWMRPPNKRADTLKVALRILGRSACPVAIRCQYFRPEKKNRLAFLSTQRLA